MLIKSLTFNKRIVEDIFKPYVIDLVKESINISLKLLDKIEPAIDDVSIITYSNMMQALTFDTHPSVKDNPMNSEFLKLDHTIY